MKINEKLVKPVREAKYLDVENTDRYRSIARLFYLNYEKLKYWMYQEEVYEELTEDPYFADYTMEQCQQDLETLTAWGNLATIQDTKRVSTIEEFKNKKFRFQLTETTVEIERMVIRGSVTGTHSSGETACRPGKNRGDARKGCGADLWVVE